jgi:hypothetical protein
MKVRTIGAISALVAVATIGLVVTNSLTPQQDVHSARLSSVAPQNKFGFAEATESPLRAPAVASLDKVAPAAAQDAAAAASAVAVGAADEDRPAPISPTSLVPGVPRIAYVYEYGYRVPADQISALQRRHADYCEAQGPQVCRILSLEQSDADGDSAAGTLELAVASDRARKFGFDLSKAATAAGGKEVRTSISGEDLSKQIVDTEARLRARSLLRDRLMEVLANRKGSVTELVEAERGVAEVNEEIDQARSWLADMKGRVEFSRLSISYATEFAAAPAQSGSFIAPISAVFSGIGAILGKTVAVLIALMAMALPIGLLCLLIRLALRKWRDKFGRGDLLEAAELGG